MKEQTKTSQGYYKKIKDNRASGSTPTEGKSYSNLEPLQNKITELENKINSIQLKVIETLGIFVALFTFVSVEVPLLKSDVSKLSATGITLIMLGGLLIFILMLVYLLNGGKNIFWSIVALVIIAVGIIFVSWDYVGMSNEINENFYNQTQINNLFSDKQKLLDKKIDENSLNSIMTSCYKQYGYISWQCFQNKN